MTKGRLSLALAFALVSGMAAAKSDKAVARIGDRSLSPEAVGSRLGRLALEQRRELGPSPQKAARAFLDAVLVPELRLDLEAARRHLERSPRVADLRREVLRRALERAMGEEIELQQPVTDEAVKAYYEKNSAHFSQPQGLRLFRVLLGGERQAKALIAEAQKPDGLERWSRFAREHSLDKATHLRRGDLGFVHANGETDVPRVQVDPVLFEAAQRVPDGAVVPEPVPEAGKLAVVWRRGSRPERKRSLAEERDAIRAMLERDRVAEAEAQLIARLERKHVTEHHPERLEIFPEGPLAEPVPRGRPALRARASDAGVSPPVQTERGLR